MKKRLNQRKVYLLLGLGVLLILGGFLLKNSYALEGPIKSITITSSKVNYQNKEPGSFQIEKSAEWISYRKARITFDVKTSFKEKADFSYRDIIFVLDISGSMSGNKLERVKTDTIELMNSLLFNTTNRAALVTFDSTSEILSNFSNNKEELIRKVEGLEAGGNTNYYQALLNVENILKDYIKEDNRETIVLFLTDGYPCEDTPNEVGEYQFLKEEYPYITVNGVQYEMGSSILDPVKKISDNQYLADINTLNNVLFEASVAPVTYSNFEITDYINSEYFEIERVEDIKVSQGEVKLEYENDIPKVTWTMNHTLRSGSSANMTIDIKLKGEYLNIGGLYPTNIKEEVISSIEGNKEEDILSKDTPILSDNYTVQYDGNAPEGCSVEGVPVSKNHSVFSTVLVSEEKPTCEGYQFKGWKIVTEGVTKVNDDYFIMPEGNVVIRAEWGKLSIVKNTEGTVHKVARLYSILEEQATSGGLAREYTGSHQDSIDASGDKKIYHYYATNNTEGIEIQNKNNVIFAGKCWQMIRTTDTGGVKMIYNGVPDSNGGCTATGDAASIGNSAFNSSSNSPAYVGYMYGDVYSYSQASYSSQYQSFTTTQTMLSSISLSTSYWYADSIKWNSTTKKYSLVNPYKVSSTSEYLNLVGKYTTLSSNQADTSRSAYYIAGVSGSYMDYRLLSNGELIKKDDTIVFGDSIIENEDGTYTLENPQTMLITDFYKDWATNYANYRKKYICNGSNITCSNPRYIALTSLGNYQYINVSDKILIAKGRDGLTLTDTLLVSKLELIDNPSNYSEYKYTCNSTDDICTEENLRMITSYNNAGYSYVSNRYFGSSVKWNEETKTYTLIDSIELENYNNLDNLSIHHYMCTGSNSCSSVKYIYSMENRYDYYYITLSNGVESVEEAMDGMFTKNTNDSAIKTKIDTWYEENLMDYQDYLEDTIFCNDRGIRDLGGWNPNGGNTSKFLYFKQYNVTRALSCTNITDRFSISNEKAKLKYPIGLMSAPEMNLLNNDNARKTGSSYWTGSPNFFQRNYSSGNYVRFDGEFSDYSSYVRESYGVRPSISLRPGTMYSEGDGSKENPYIVDMDVIKG